MAWASVDREELPTPRLFVALPSPPGPSQLSAVSSSASGFRCPLCPNQASSAAWWRLVDFDPGLDSRDCPSQWTCIFPLILFLNPAVLPADCRPHPCPHPPLCGLLTGVQTLRLRSCYCLQSDPPARCSLSLAPLLNLEQPEV